MGNTMIDQLEHIHNSGPAGCTLISGTRQFSDPPVARSATPHLRALLWLATMGVSSCTDSQERLTDLGFPEQTLSTWSHYLGDPGRTHYSSLAQIDTSNVATLQVAWTYASGGLEAGVNTEIQHNPLIVDSALYGTNARLRLFKIDARTGEEIWRIDSLDAGEMPPWFGRSRGLMRWVSSDGGDERIYFGAGPYLFAADAGRGHLVDSFGNSGRVDLRVGLGRDPERLSIHLNTPGVVFENLLIVGGRVDEGPGAAPGHVRAYDAQTGEVVWTFHTIPQPGEFGYDTWPADAHTYTGGANSWAGMALDADRGIVFVPTGSAAFDYYGGDRAGDNLFANTLLALDARTGVRIWHYQFVKHDVWDRDLPAPPNLVTVERNGERIPAVAQITKSAHIYLFHRETGEPIFPIEEFQVPASTVLGEATSPTQSLPTTPAPFGRQQLTEDMLYAPDQPAQIANLVSSAPPAEPMTVRDLFRRLTSRGQFVPPDTVGVIVYPGLDGGGEWGGAAVDPTRGVMYVNGSEMAWIVGLKRIDPKMGRGEAIYRMNCVRCHGGVAGATAGPPLEALGERMSPDSARAVIRFGRATMPAHPQFSDAELSDLVAYLTDPHRAWQSMGGDAVHMPYGLATLARFLDGRGKPVVEPPWGALNAIDLNSGETLWRVPLGDDDEIDDPEHPVTGTENYGGPVVTAGGLVFIAATNDERIRAFHAGSGEQLWEAELPAGGYATPATYEVDGRQYVVIAAGGGKMGTPSGDRYVAYALPREQ